MFFHSKKCTFIKDIIMYYILECIIVSFLEVSLKIHFAQKSEGAVYIFIFYMVTFESPKWQLTVSHI